MKPTDLVLRCYAHKCNNHWETFCIDLCLAAQGETFAIAKRKLEEQMDAYVTEALTIDREYAAQLLSRKAPLKQILTFHLYSVMRRSGLARDGIRRLFTEVLPIIPRSHRHA